MGTVDLRAEGLYYRIHCVCRVMDGQIHRLYADDEKMGVLIPEQGALVLDAKVAAKRVKKGCRFSLDENQMNLVDEAIAVSFGLHDNRTT